MPLNRPTIATLIDRAVSDIKGRLPGTEPLLRHSVLGVIARVLAGAAHGLYGAVEYIARQTIPSTAESEYLDRWATLWLTQQRLPAAMAVGNIDFTGTVGATVPVGTLYHTADGAEYETTAAVVLGAGGTGTAAAKATDAGVAGNIAAGVTLTASSPVTGVDATATVGAGGFTGGADIESDDDLRARLIARIQQAPHGGAAADYEQWAQEVAGVDRVWISPLYAGDGTVRVWIGDNDYAGATQASAALVAEVQTYIDARRPVTAAVTVIAPTNQPVDVTMTLAPGTQAVRDAVTAELQALFLRDAAPEGTVRRSRISEAISIADGESGHVITAPAADVTAAGGSILTLGTVTYL